MTRDTSVTIRVPAQLRACCNGASDLSMPAADLRSALEELERRFPSLYGNVCDETGMVRRHVNIFVNARHMRDRSGLDTPLEAGDVVTILPAISGG